MMKNIEEYLYYHENRDYINLKFLSCTYHQAKRHLRVRYLYNAEIEEYLPTLQKRLEELFIRQVGLPLKYEFVYEKVFCDALSLKLKIMAFLRKKYGAMSKATNDDSVVVNLNEHTWQIQMNLPANLIEFLHDSIQWQNFQQDLRDHDFYDYEFSYHAV